MSQGQAAAPPLQVYEPPSRPVFDPLRRGILLRPGDPAPPSETELRDLAARLLVACPGAQVWLFGGAARGDWRRGSDVDLAVVAPQGAPAPEARDLYGAVGSTRWGVDLVAFPAERFAAFAAHVPGSFPATIVGEGRRLV